MCHCRPIGGDDHLGRRHRDDVQEKPGWQTSVYATVGRIFRHGSCRPLPEDPSACPRAPRSAPVPPTIAQLPVSPEGCPGGAEPPLIPRVMIVPIGVPSACKISKMFSRIAVRLTSAMARPGGGFVFAPAARTPAANNPFAGCPFTATMSPITVFNAKFGVCPGPFPTSAVGVMFGF